MVAAATTGTIHQEIGRLDLTLVNTVRSRRRHILHCPCLRNLLRVVRMISKIVFHVGLKLELKLDQHCVESILHLMNLRSFVRFQRKHEFDPSEELPKLSSRLTYALQRAHFVHHNGF